jgi:hypothetical protein
MLGVRLLRFHSKICDAGSDPTLSAQVRLKAATQKPQPYLRKPTPPHLRAVKALEAVRGVEVAVCFLSYHNRPRTDDRITETRRRPSR